MKLSTLKEKLLNEMEKKGEKRISSVRAKYKPNGILLNQNQVVSNEENLANRTTYDTDATVYNQKNDISKIQDLSYINGYVDQETFNTDGETKNSSLDKVKIIGITGSRGKSTTAFIVHEYLKSLGYKSILYSSIRVDSPVSYANIDESCEIPLKNDSMLLNILEEAESYDADYVVLEVNESAIAKGLTKNIPFTVKALTNIEAKHNMEVYSAAEYVELKKSFFTSHLAEQDCTCVYGLTGDMTREEFNQLLKLNNHPKITFGTKYISEKRNADYTNLDCLLYEMSNSLKGLSMKTRVKEKVYDFTTSLILPHNALNLTCAIAIIEALNMLDPEKFNLCIKDIKVPGREEVIKVNNRTIVIGLFLMPALENFKCYQANQEIDKIRVVTGAVGTGFVTWNQEFLSERYLNERSKARSFAMNYASQNADHIYLTSNDNAAEDPLTIALELESYLNNSGNTSVLSTILIDRYEAIKKALQDSKPSDVIYISGRGNRSVLCDSASTYKLFKDKEAVEQIISELKW